jgi:hypothetical protein
VSAYIAVGAPATVERGDTRTLRVRWDDGPAEEQRWGVSTDSEALFTQHPINFTDRLLTAKRLRVEFTPFNAAPAVMDFTVEGFGQARIDALKAGCQKHWDRGPGLFSMGKY